MVRLLPDRASTRLVWPSIVVGVGGAAIGAAYVGVLHVLEPEMGPGHYSVALHAAVLIAVGLAAGGLVKVIGSPGDVELLVDNVHVTGGPEDLRQLRSLLPVSLLCIAAGGAMGPEAPLVQTTGSWGAWLAPRMGAVSVEDRRTLTLAGMAAGFTVLFGAPLGSAVFALELLHRRGMQYYEALLPALIGSMSGYAVYATLTHVGLSPTWRFPVTTGSVRPADIAWAVGCGAAGAGVAVMFTLISTATRRVLRPCPPNLRPFLGGLALALLGWWSPYALTFGEAQINPLVVRGGVAAFFVGAAVAKFAGTTVTLASGWRGGFIIPMFFVGMTLGRAAHIVLPSTNEVVLMTALMVAINVGVTKTVLGTTMVVTEMAGVHLLPTTLIAAVVALLLTSSVGVIHTQRERAQVTGGREADTS